MGKEARPLHDVARRGDAEQLQILLEKHASAVNSVDMYKQTPLMKAATSGSAACVKLLLDAKADLNQR